MPRTPSVSVGNPTLWFARVLRHRLIDAGICVDGEAVDVDDLAAPPDRSISSVLHVHRSRPLSDIVKPLFKDSINLYGEAILRLNAPRTANERRRHRATRSEAWWPGEFRQTAQQLVDGSGLSRRDVVAAETLVARAATDVRRRSVLAVDDSASRRRCRWDAAGRACAAHRRNVTCAQRPDRCRTSGRWPAT